MKKTSILILLILLAVFACEKDDICSEATATTPQLVVRFYDALIPEDTKSVSGLFVYGINDANEAVFFKNITVGTKDSIAIPLRTDSDMTKLVFHSDFSIDDNGTPDDGSDDIVLGNPDTVDVNYARDDIYVSRACGYKATFTNLGAVLTLDTDNWTTQITIENNTIDNENAAHINIYH
ncbi:DUF6452 family protein [Flavobacteriaceae bacterium S0825]|uniref:DUF6452 family protein n=1 Tax=Gaetbulibacter sp. S0825 TaxID=2720084 RepID=UPI00142F649A|nr:DUF6452 family protein [Gaetbulibacter sp. S0825]MCK0109898.1 DUF6452 family protein [Flavobacteriaceae bacterium S0825]NIX65527.1 hypothetical protein [Gaetbulibacter sp. S0825]